MKRSRTLLVVAVSIVLLALAGPRVHVDTSWTEVVVPQDVDAWLAESESQVSDVREGLEKGIIWADSSHSKTPYAVVYLHGFSASRLETSPFSDSIAAALGANLFYTRLSGHGQNGEALGRAKAQEWIQNTVESIRIGEAIGDSLILISTSTGGTLSAWASAQPELSARLAGQIWVSPNFGPKASRSGMLLWPWGRSLLKMIQGESYGFEPQNPLHESYGTNEFGSEVLLEMMGLVEVVENQDFSLITSPVLLVYSPTDTVVDPVISIDVYDHLGSARKDSMVVLQALDENNHVIVGDALGPENTMRVAHRAVEFLNKW